VEDRVAWEKAMFFIEKYLAQAELASADPLKEKVEAMVRGMEAISTVALLDLLGLPKTTGNGRRLAASMRSLGFIPIKSRKFEPGGWRDTVTRGWARPVRQTGSRSNLKEIVTVKPCHSNSSSTALTQQKECCDVL
jgi:hypothetical protein